MNFLWIYNPDADFNKYFEMVSNLQLDTVIANPYMYDNPNFLSRVKQSERKLAVNYPIFDDQEYLSDNQDKYAITAQGKKAQIDWLNFTCPTDEKHIKQKLKNLEKMLRKLNPAFVSLDFIRFFTFWEKVKLDSDLADIEDGCYCSNCLDLLEKRTDFELKNQKPGWIKENCQQELKEFRVSHITSLVRRFSEVIKKFNSNIKVMMKVVPWLNSDFNGARLSLLGQDYSDLKDYIDIFMPMTYLHTINFSPGKMTEIISEAKQLSGKDIIPLIQIEKIYDEDDLTNEDFIQLVSSAHQEKIEGLGIFRYEDLVDNKERYNLLKELLFSKS